MITLLGLYFFYTFSAIQDSSPPVPVIYCTDLFHPHDDPDDHFDLACMYALTEFDIKAIILDQGRKQEERPGRIPIGLMNYLTNRAIPCAIGLADPLTHPEDTGEDQGDSYQAGVRQIVSILNTTQHPIIIIAVGSLRDIAAAFNREPKLFQDKVSRLYVFIGEAQGLSKEYNAELDIHAYRRIMNAPLPIYWTPCFDGGMWKNEGNASFWRAGHDVLLADTSAPVVNFFIHAFLHKPSIDPKEILYTRPTFEEKQRVLSEQRNLWCCAVFPYIAGRIYVQRSEGYLAIPVAAKKPEDVLISPFSYEPVHLYITEEGKEHYSEHLAPHPIHRFRITDSKRYIEVMTSVTRELLKELSRTCREHR